MRQAWFLHPVFPYILGAAAVALCGVLYWVCRASVRLKPAPQANPAEHFASAIADLRAQVKDLSTQMKDSTDRTQIVAPSVPLGSGLNLNKRSIALQMHRRGESPVQIAAALNIPRNEVELLLKVHRLVLSHF
jgi:hypothetical protein